MILFYQETNGDFLAIDTATNTYYRQVLGKNHFEGRATAIEGQVGSVCTTGISMAFLRANCKRVAKATVPDEWRRAIGFDNLPVVWPEGQPRHDGDAEH